MDGIKDLIDGRDAKRLSRGPLYSVSGHAWFRPSCKGEKEPDDTAAASDVRYDYGGGDSHREELELPRIRQPVDLRCMAALVVDSASLGIPG